MQISLLIWQSNESWAEKLMQTLACQLSSTLILVSWSKPIKIQMVYWRILWKKKDKSADVIWRGFDAICVSFSSRSTTNENAHRSRVIV